MHRFATVPIAVVAFLASAVPLSRPLTAAPLVSSAGASSDAAARSTEPCDCSHYPWPEGCVLQCREHHHSAATKRYRGEVASVDATAKSFVVHPKKGADVTLKVNDKTKYSKGVSWDDVKAGAAVSGSYKNDGTDNWATTVNFPKAAAAPAAKTGI